MASHYATVPPNYPKNKVTFDITGTKQKYVAYPFTLTNDDANRLCIIPHTTNGIGDYITIAHGVIPDAFSSNGLVVQWGSYTVDFAYFASVYSGLSGTEIEMLLSMSFKTVRDVIEAIKEYYMAFVDLSSPTGSPSIVDPSLYAFDSQSARQSGTTFTMPANNDNDGGAIMSYTERQFIRRVDSITLVFVRARDTPYMLPSGFFSRFQPLVGGIFILKRRGTLGTISMPPPFPAADTAEVCEPLRSTADFQSLCPYPLAPVVDTGTNGNGNGYATYSVKLQFPVPVYLGPANGTTIEDILVYVSGGGAALPWYYLEASMQYSIN